MDMSQLEIDYMPEAVDDTSVLHLRGEASFREAPELRRQLFEVISEHRTSRLVIELEEVEKMDTAAMAVLVEGLMATRRDGPDVFFCTPSDSVRKVFELAGLQEALDRCHGCLGDVLKAAPVTAMAS